MILNHLLNSENEGGRALRIAYRCEGDDLEETWDFWEGICETGIHHLSYVNLQEAPMTGTSLAESLIMRNLTRFLWLGIARLMGKNIPKRNKTISYQSLRYRKRLYTS